MDATQADFDKLKAQMDELINLFVNHTHSGFDQTLPITNTAPFYAASIDSDGSIISAPAGWSTTVNGTGDLTITHGLGLAVYMIYLGQDGSNGFLYPVSHTTTAVRVLSYSTVGNPQNVKFFVLLVPDPN